MFGMLMMVFGVITKSLLSYLKHIGLIQKPAGLFFSNFENDNLFVNIQYDFLKDFIFKADYAFDRYHNKSNDTKNTFDTANASLFYQLEDSPWGFEINATNLFNVHFKQKNAFNSFLISDSKTFILPRIVMLKVAYKL